MEFDDSIILKSELFSLLTEDELAKVKTILKHGFYPQNEVIIHEGARGREMYIVASGTVGSRTMLSNGMVREIASFGPGDFFGEMSIFEGAPRSATCYAVQDTVLYKLNDCDFFNLINRYPVTAIKIMYRMLNIVTVRLLEKNDFLSNMVQWGEDASKRAIIDEISGIYNRRYLDDALEDNFRKAEISGLPLSLVMIDIDDFTVIDEQCSDDDVNSVIKFITDTIKKSLREDDILARYGGDEFSIIFPNTGKTETMDIAGSICRDVAAIDISSLIRGIAGHVTLSIGIASYPDDAKKLGELKTKADEALYRAKTEGKNRAHCLD